ncbi:MAG: hypothetical protein RBT72_05535 [Spirochaetia bacterium]|jgi:uncharacterized protein YceK|nr:hypothetical protein [Spirochaetia bacterium]
MKRFLYIAVVVLIVVSLGGCASMLKSMGGVSKAELTALEASMDERLTKISTAWEGTETAVKEVEAMKSTVSTMQADIETIKATAKDLEDARATINSLVAKVDTLSNDTLMRLAKLIEEAVAAEKPGAPTSE